MTERHMVTRVWNLSDAFNACSMCQRKSTCARPSASLALSGLDRSFDFFEPFYAVEVLPANMVHQFWRTTFSSPWKSCTLQIRCFLVARCPLSVRSLINGWVERRVATTRHAIKMTEVARSLRRRVDWGSCCLRFLPCCLLLRQVDHSLLLLFIESSRVHSG